MKSEEILLIDLNMEIHKKYFIVNWILNDDSFAVPGKNLFFLIDQSTKKISNNTLEISKRSIEKCIQFIRQKTNKNIVFNFFGGEFFRQSEIKELYMLLKKNNCKTAIVANHFHKLQYWENISGLLDFITLNYHADYMNIETALSIVDYLRKNSIVSVNILMLDKSFKKSRAAGEKIIESFPEVIVRFHAINQNNLDFTFWFFREKLKSISYSKEQKEEIRNLIIYARERILKLNLAEKWYQGFVSSFTRDGQSLASLPEELCLKGKNNLDGWLCWAGQEQLTVDAFGNVFRAACFQDWLGNLNGKEVKWPALPIICNRKNCNNYFDMVGKKQPYIDYNTENIKKLAKMFK